MRGPSQILRAGAASATAVDDEGGSVRRTVIRAFGEPGTRGDEQAGTTKVSNLVVNGGKPVVLTIARRGQGPDRGRSGPCVATGLRWRT
ncbi:hypothetical protein [Actinacidiphila sp. bgisy160]|uniref:hypothetical protein n=1 Tax=Actinacidiphila sp. bgisy160 TaxID=3413796 RepID=UPI003D734391